MICKIGVVSECRITNHLYTGIWEEIPHIHNPITWKVSIKLRPFQNHVHLLEESVSLKGDTDRCGGAEKNSLSTWNQTMIVNLIITWYNSAQVRKFDENCALLSYYAASSGNSLRTFRENVSIPFLTLEDGTNRLSRNVGKALLLLAA
jgi:hypothetical protein